MLDRNRFEIELEGSWVNQERKVKVKVVYRDPRNPERWTTVLQTGDLETGSETFEAIDKAERFLRLVRDSELPLADLWLDAYR
jgi:hypothetical protein